MSAFFTCPRIPDRQIEAALISGEYSFLRESLNRLGISTLETEADLRLPVPVRFHPDMQICCLKPQSIFVLQGNPLFQKIKRQRVEVWETEEVPEPFYPKDALCNALVIGQFLVANPLTLDQKIQNAAMDLNLQLLKVRQGYVGCSVALVNNCSLITSDPGIAKALEQQGLDVLRIRPGGIRLPGYDTGFLGGCCGLLSKDIMAFTGKVSTHPDGQAIRDFLKARDVFILELSQQELLDVGGIVPLW